MLGIFTWVQAIYHWTIFPACVQRKLSPGAGTWVRSVRTSMALSGIVKGVGWSEVLHTKGEVVSAHKKKSLGKQRVSSVLRTERSCGLRTPGTVGEGRLTFSPPGSISFGLGSICCLGQRKDLWAAPDPGLPAHVSPPHTPPQPHPPSRACSEDSA